MASPQNRPYVVDPARRPVFPEGLEPDENGLIAVGGDLSEAVLIEAYGKGLFPWMDAPPLLWFSPDPRLVLYPQDFHLSRRLARVLRQGRFSVRFDEDFEGVISACASVPRPGQRGTWIDERFKQAYTRLYRRHLVHCVSAKREGTLCGGLYGLSLGRIFFGESMFSLLPNASKVALFHLVEWVKQRQFILIDCQASSEHLLGLGAVEIPRSLFHAHLREGLKFPTLDYPWVRGPAGN